MKDALRNLATGSALVGYVLLRALPFILLPGGLATCAWYGGYRVSSEVAARAVAERSMQADAEVRHGPVRLRVPRGFVPPQSREWPSAPPPMEWTGRGGILRLRFGQHATEGSHFADRYAAEIILWVPSSDASGAPLYPSDQAAGSFSPGETQTSTRSNARGSVATLEAAPSIYSEAQRDSILTEVLSSTRVDQEGIDQRVNDFRQEFAERHASIEELENLFARGLGIEFERARLQAPDARTTFEDMEIRNGASETGNFVHNGVVIAVCRVLTDIRQISTITGTLPQIARTVSGDPATAFRYRSLIALMRDRDSNADIQLLWSERAGNATGESRVESGLSNFLAQSALPSLQRGALVYAASTIEEDNVQAARQFLADVSSGCSRSMDSVSQPATEATMAEVMTPVVERPPRIGPLTSADIAFEAASNAAPISQRAFRDVFGEEGVGPIMVAVPMGRFRMGAGPQDGNVFPDQLPSRRIEVHSFAASRFEVTWNEWRECVTDGGCEDNSSKSFPGSPRQLRGDAGYGRGFHPLINVSWEDATAYARWLSEKTGHHYRLLSEAEWEYAARAGTTGEFAFAFARVGDANYVHNLFPIDDREPRPRVVGQYPPNAFGLYDMFGNVYEWTQDCYARYDVPGRLNDGASFETSPCHTRSLRGASFAQIYSWMASARRHHRPESWRSWDLGFRVARDE